MIRLLLAFVLLAGCSVFPKWSDERRNPGSVSGDQFGYLEDIQGSESLAWVNQQNLESKAQLETPRFFEFLSQNKNILNSVDKIPSSYFVGDEVENFWQDATHVRGIVRRSDYQSFVQGKARWRTILDVDQLASQEQANWVFKGLRCLSPDFQRCLVFLSDGGKDSVVVRELHATTGLIIADGFLIPEGKSKVVYKTKDTLLVAADTGPQSLTKSGYPRQLRLLDRGQQLGSAQVIAEVPENYISLFPIVDEESREVFILKGKTFFTSELEWWKESKVSESLPLPAEMRFQEVRFPWVYVSLLKDWAYQNRDFRTGQVIRMHAQSKAVELVWSPSYGQSLSQIAVSQDFLYLNSLDNASSRLDVFQINDLQKAKSVPLPKFGSIDVNSVHRKNGNALVTYSSFLHSPRLYEIQALDKKVRVKVVDRTPDRFAEGGLEVQQHWAISTDGTRIPYFQVSPRGMRLNGNNPVLQYGYGGFLVSLTPSYAATLGKTWMEAGGVFVVANIRGGGEFGPEWHQAAIKDRRQVAFDDFIAVSEDLIRRRVTRPQRLGIYGGSNGGLLVGSVMTQRPDLFGAVVCLVPLLDMLRYHRLLAGASWMAEYGDPDDPKLRPILAAYSPYHQLKASVKYPKAFVSTSTLDDRVHPGHARKFVARLKSFGQPVLYFENTEGGHAGASNLNQRAYLDSLMVEYLWQQLRD